MMQRYYLEKAEYDKNIDQLNAWAEYTSSPEEVSPSSFGEMSQDA